MKTLKITLIAILMCTVAVFKLQAQDYREDVVYLKNGSIYRGTIIEQVPNVSLKIEIAGGSVVAINMADVTKMTKEPRVYDQPRYPMHEHFGMHGWRHMDSATKAQLMEFHPRRRGYFLQAQLLIENLQGGVRIINGYKFNRFAYLGIGIGADFLFNAPMVNRINGVNIDKSLYKGTYFPLYLYYSGDILNKRITPFYAIEGGWTVRVSDNNGINMMDNNFDTHHLHGGPMGGVGIGFKVYTHHRVNMSLLANMNFKRVSYDDVNYTYDPITATYTTYNVRQNVFLLIPGIRLGLGF